MSDEPQVRLAARNEGLEVRAAGAVYHFNVRLAHGVWHVELPPTTGDAHAEHELSEAEIATILPAIRRYLGRIYWLALFPRSYDVRFDRSNGRMSREDILTGLERDGWQREEQANGTVRMTPPPQRSLLKEIWRRLSNTW